MVNPHSNLGQLATGKLSMSSMMSDPTGTSSHPRAGGLAHLPRARARRSPPSCPSMNVPTAHPVSVPTERDVHGTVVLAAAFANVLRAFL